MIHAMDVDQAKIQDPLELVAIGADVEALYPNLADLEVANICYEAVMKRKTAFTNINYRKALQYIAICMHKTDQRSSPLWRALPRRTSKGGVRPGVTASPETEEHWYFGPSGAVQTVSSKAPWATIFGELVRAALCRRFRRKRRRPLFLVNSSTLLFLLLSTTVAKLA